MKTYRSILLVAFIWTSMGIAMASQKYKISTQSDGMSRFTINFVLEDQPDMGKLRVTEMKVRLPSVDRNGLISLDRIERASGPQEPGDYEGHITFSNNYFLPGLDDGLYDLFIEGDTYGTVAIFWAHPPAPAK